MATVAATRIPLWSWIWPALGLVILVVHFLVGGSTVLNVAEAVALIATVFAAVFHAEMVALRVGEPFGTLVLALAVTTIEVALIVSMMIAGGPGTASLARDTLFAAVMIVCTGIIGICLLAGGLRHHEQGFQLRGANAALSVLIAMTTLTLILPNVTTTTPGPTFSRSQLAFAAVVSLVLYGSFVFVQTIRHRDYFLLVGVDEQEAHMPPPANKVAWMSAALLLGSLMVVVALAKALTPAVEHGIEALGAPKSVVGIVIAALVLLPEGLASYRAATANRLQTSVNLALGSALASLGLTIPAVAGISLLLGRPLILGLDPKEEVLLVLTLVVSILTLGTGRTTMLQGTVHLILFVVFLFLAIAP
ncbi:MAG TPA: ionic transporter y4hA [Candidatus Binatia bacterium]|nr:ionic transporter y4hA [Candidatus Binatia bacterium]